MAKVPYAVLLALMEFACTREKAPSPVPAAVPRSTSANASGTSSATGAASASASMPPSTAPARIEKAPEPSYDLSVDVEARKLTARQQLGNRISVQVVRGVFVVVGPLGQVSGAARTVEVAIDTYLNGRFTRAPSRAVSVYLFPSAKPYEAYCKRRWNEPCISAGLLGRGSLMGFASWLSVPSWQNQNLARSLMRSASWHLAWSRCRELVGPWLSDAGFVLMLLPPLP